LIKKNPKFAVKSLKGDRFKYKLSDTLKDRFSYNQKYFTKANSWDYCLIKNFEENVAPIRKVLSKLQKLIVALEQIKSDESQELGSKYYSLELSLNSSYEFIDEVIPYLFNSKSFVSMIYRHNEDFDIKFAKNFLGYNIVVKTDFTAGEGTVHILVPVQILHELEGYVKNGCPDDVINHFINRNLEEEVEDIYQAHMNSYFEKTIPEAVYQDLIIKFPELKEELLDE
jgi:hypothetical protein